MCPGKRLQEGASAALPSPEESSQFYISTKSYNMTIIQVYNPTSDDDDEEVEMFYVESTIVEVPKKDIIIVQGDWNTIVGQGTYENWASWEVWHCGDQRQGL